jgi:serine/threonine protein kinase
MPLENGTSLGPYIIENLVGAGGMGEVYKARDTRLDRIVAIKTLPDTFARDPERLARFEREARTIAALTHPNVITLYDVGTQSGKPFLVSEFLTGKTLREVLKDGRLPLRKAIGIGTDIAAGLSAAHESGIIHRDLKPENVFIVADGRAKVLDFGLARIGSGTMEAAAGATSSCTAIPATDAGMVLGTVGYMSPEQVKGNAADHRSDIFALGAILYELITGDRAFHRGSSVETMHAILNEDPPEIVDKRPELPPALERILRHCLEKEPGHRFQSARDLAFDLASLSTMSDSSGTRAIRQKSRRRSTASLLIVGTLAVAAAIGVWFGTGFRARPPHFQPLTFQRGYVSNARFAPDGQTVVYSAAWSAKPSEMFTTTIATQESRRLGVPKSAILAVSKKGELALLLNAHAEMAGFITAGTLARMYMTGGTVPREIASDVHGADWSPDGNALCVLHADQSGDKIDYPLGTTVYRVAMPAWLSDVRISPKGDRIAFIVHPDRGDDRGSVTVIDTAGAIIFNSANWSGIYGLVWKNNEELLVSALPQQEKTSRQLFAIDLHGTARMVMEVPGELTVYDIAANGSMLVTLNQRNIMLGAVTNGEQHDLSWLDRSILDRFTADGSAILFHEGGQGGGPLGSTYLGRLDGSPALRLSEGYGVDISPDGKWVMTVIPEKPPRYRIVPTGPGEAWNVAAGGLSKVSPLGFRRDGKKLVWLANKDSEDARMYETDFAGQNARPIAPPGHVPVVVSLNGRYEIRKANGSVVLWDHVRNAGEPITTIQPTDMVAGVADDGPWAFIAAPSSGHIFEIARLNVRTGARIQVAAIVMSDMTGVRGLNRLAVSPDGKTVAYSYTRHLSQLYFVEARQR